MSSFRVIDQLEAILRQSTRIPLTSFIFMDVDRLLAILEKLRLSLPEEMKQARYLTQENHRILKEAHEKAEAILQSARQEAQEKVMENEIVKAAREHAATIISQANLTAKEMREGAEAYVRDVLFGLEGELERLMIIVRNGKAKLGKPESSKARAFLKQLA